MEGIVITSETLESTATQVLNQKAQMESLFEQIKQEIRSMNSYWQSPASDAALQQFEQLAPTFGKYIEFVNNYIVYLQQTATAYRENETALSSGV